MRKKGNPKKDNKNTITNSILKLSNFNLFANIF